MVWWEGFDETRVLIAPDPGGSGNVGCLLSLRHPKSGNATCYLLVNGVLQELHWFKQFYGSWFLGDYVCDEGSLYYATSVDPVFIMLPIFEEARMKKEDDPGKFRQLDEIIFIEEYPDYQQLMPILEKSMQIVCEIKEMGSSKFYRLDDSKVLDWLYYKVCQLSQTLPTLDGNYAAQDEKATLVDAVSTLGEYVKDEPWLQLLCDHLSLNLLEVTRKAPCLGSPPSTMDCNEGLSNEIQEKKSDKKATKTGRQAKKAKVETQSHNIKDMFSRASRRRN